MLPSKTAIMPVNRELMPTSSDDIERCSRTVYAANIDKKVDRNDVRAFFESLCGEARARRGLLAASSRAGGRERAGVSSLALQQHSCARLAVRLWLHRLCF